MERTVLEEYFERFRKNTVGHDLEYDSPCGRMMMIYADWVATGRLYLPIENRMTGVIGPWVANTHSEASESGTRMTQAYQYALQKIKKEVNA